MPGMFATEVPNTMPDALPDALHGGDGTEIALTC